MSSSLDAQQLPTPTRKKALDYFKLYPTDQETFKVLEKSKKGGISDLDNVPNKVKKPETPRPGKVGGKKNKKELLNLSNMNTSLNISRDARVTSTPYGKDAKLSVKPIIKQSAVNESNEESITLDHSEIISKKRHKSVSFQLDEADETAIKKSKSNAEPSHKNLKKGKYKIKKQRKFEKESNEPMDTVNQSEDKLEMDTHEKENKPTSKKYKQVKVTENTILNDSIEQSKKKFKKNKQNKMESEQIENDKNNNDNNDKVKNKKNKKKNSLKQSNNDSTKDEKKSTTTSEQQGKNTKKDLIPEVIAEDLENLSIADGDKADIITDMLDDMSVVDKSAKKKSKGKAKLGKNKKGKTNNEETKDDKVTTEGEEVKEKVVWKKRRWNKDKKAVVGISLQTTVIVQNLPAKIMQEYRKLLTEHFTKCGPVKSIGVAETYPEDKSVFSTTVNFGSEEAATLALQETDTILHGAQIRVKRPLPPTKTTLVARSYGALTEQALSDLFQPAGRIRGMRFLIKGKKSMSTAFIEFEGPRAVERAIEIAKEAKIGGKNMHVSRFEERLSKKTKPDTGAKETGNKEPMST